MKGLAEQMKGTYEAAEEAWDDYRKRFAEVDKVAGRWPAEKMSSTLGDSLSQFSAFATKTDHWRTQSIALGCAVTIEEYAEALADYVEQHTKGPAE